MDAIIINDKTHVLVKNNSGIGNDGCEECSLIELCCEIAGPGGAICNELFKKKEYHFELK